MSSGDIRKITLSAVGSTNDYAKTLAFSHGGNLTVIRAARQTGGRGRNGNEFFSDHEGGLWVSVVTPIADMSKHFEHNRAMSLSILNALKNIDPNAQIKIKWPNDIYWGDKKICGILLENMPSVPNALIIGFGLNVNIPRADFPQSLRDSATSVLIETGREVSPLDGMLDEIIDSYIKYREDRDQERVHKLYSESLYKVGSRAAAGEHVGIFAGVETDGRLRLTCGGGDKLIMSGTLLYV